MAINFPNSPSLNETYSENDTSWKWDGTSWNRLTGLVGTESSTLSGVGITQFARRDVNNVITGITTLSTSGVGNTTLNVEGDSRFGSNIKVTGVSTFTGNIDANGALDVDGQTDLDVLNVAETATFTGNIDANGNLDVDGQTDLDVLNVAETATFSALVDINADLDVDGHTNLDNISVAGVSTFSAGITGTTADFSGDVTIGGVLTYEDVKNVDSVGIVTAREGIFLPDTKELKLGNSAASPDLKLYSTGTNGWVFTPQSGADLYMGTNAGEVYIQTGSSGNDTAIKVNSGGSVELNHSTNKKLETTSTGVTVTGKVGINSTSPSYALEVDGGTQNTVIVARSSDAKAAISFLDNTTGGYGRATIGGEGTEVYITSGTGGAEALRIDSSGRVLIGTTTEGFSSGDDLTIETSGHTGMTIRSGTTSEGAVYFSDATSGAAEYVGSLTYSHNTNAMVFTTNGLERLRINSVGTVRIKRAVSTSLGNDSIFLAIGDTENGTNVNRMIGFGYNSNFGTSVYPASMGYTETDNSGNTKGALTFNTRNTTGATDVPVERVRISGHGQLIAGATLTGTEGGSTKLCIVGTGSVGANPSSISASTLATFRMTGAAGHAAGISILAGNGASSALNFGDSDNELIGRVLYNHTSGNATDYMAFYVQGSERLRITAAGNLALGNDGSFPIYTDTNDRNFILGTGSEDAAIQLHSGTDKYGGLYFGDATSGGDRYRGYIEFKHGTSDDYLRFAAGGTERLRLDKDGHITPAAAGTQNLGSTAKEWGDLFIADDKKVQIGSSQDLQIYHTTSGTSWIRHTNSSEYFLIEGNQMDFRDYATGVYRARMGTAVQLYYNGNNEKFRTTNTGITVTGEVAATQDYPTIRPTLDLNFAAVKKLDSRITYRRTGPASYVDEFGKIVFVGDNTPRFDHDPSTRECKGFLLEESRKNYIENGDFVSSYGSGNYWTYGVGTDVFSASSGSQLSTNPDGSSPAYHYAPSSTAGYHRFYRAVTVDVYDTSYVASVFVKRVTAGSASNLNRYFEIELSGNLANNPAPTGHSGSHGMSSVTFDLQDLTSQYAGNSAVNSSGVVGDPKIEDYGNGWYRCSYVFNPGQFDSNSTLTAVMWLGHPATMAAESGNEQGNGNPSFYIWGAMVEKGASLTSYVPNHGTYQVTRGKDLAEIDGEEFTEFFNQDEGTINCAYWLGNDNIGLRVFQINDSSNSVIDIVAGSGGGAGGYGYVNTGGSAQANGGQSSTNASRLNTLHVTTLAYKENDIAGINRNTGVLTNDTSATLDGAYNRVTFYQGANGADQLNGHLQRVQYYPKRLSDNQLKNLNNQ